MRTLLLMAMLTAVSASTSIAADYPIRPVPFTAVTVDDAFWSPRLETNRKVTVWYDFQKCEETGRNDNFAKAGGLMKGPFKGIFYDDSDVYKVIEGASYTLARHPDEKLDKYLDDLIAKIAAAQEDDGYLYTARTLNPDNPPEGSGKERWSNLRVSHELYNLGHLYEAAVAHFEATGKRSLLDVALKSANLVDSVFGAGKRHDPPGHQEIEIGLAKLYRTTGDERYLRLAKFFLDERGYEHGRKLYGAYAQDHRPVVEQDEAVGHAVRAAYMYAGMADVAALTGDRNYVKAIDKIWENTVAGKLYITGGLGARHQGEAFGDLYELPNKTAYNETCAAIANCLWNQRMFMLHGDAKYIDVLERTIYNGFLSGVSLSGDRFFYPNPLSADGKYKFNHGSATRAPWFGTSCCPVNVVRFLPSIAGYVFAQRDNEVYVNLFISGEAKLKLPGGDVKIKLDTKYPWDGHVKITLEPEQPQEFTILLRNPGWARNVPLPGDLYRFTDRRGLVPSVRIREPTTPINEMTLDEGYYQLRSLWKKGDVIEYNIPMEIRRVVTRDEVTSNAGRVALVRGPIVYCVEGVDHGGAVKQLVLPDNAELTPEHRDDLLGGVTVLRGQGLAATRKEDGSITTQPAELTAIPYYAWSHRGVGPMEVWLPRSADLAEAAPKPTIASQSRVSASHIWQADTADALNDQELPTSSGDGSIPRLTWWNHRGTKEWAQYEFAKPTEVSKIAVYWFDDTGTGQCRTPKSWKLLYRDGDDWKEAPGVTKYGVELDRMNEVTFDPVRTSALRIEVQLQPEYSGGILEWVVE